MSDRTLPDPGGDIRGDKLYDLITEAAKHHGLDSEDPDHEVGDLQEALEAAIGLLFPDQCQRLFADLRESIAESHWDYDPSP